MNLFATQISFSQAMFTIAIFAAGFGVDQLIRYFIWEGYFSKIHQIKAPGLLVGVVRTAIYFLSIFLYSNLYMDKQLQLL